MKLLNGLLLSLALFAVSANAADIKVLSDRNQAYFQKVVDAFTAKTGKSVEIVTASWSDIKKSLKEGQTGDVLLVKDIDLIVDASNEGVFQRLSDANLNAGVPAHMRDAGGNWTAVSYRVRTLVYDPAMVDVSALSSYEAIAKPEFQGQLCVRNSKEYMPTLVAWLIATYGEPKAREIVTGWRNNVAQFTAGDTKSIEQIEAGSCTVGISNHYYYARMKTADNRLATSLMFTNQQDGLHTNGFGGGVLKTASNVDGANAFINFILSAEGSSIMIQDPSFEYPAVASNRPTAFVESLGSFKASTTPWSAIGAETAKAREILESVGWPNQ